MTLTLFGSPASAPDAPANPQAIKVIPSKQFGDHLATAGWPLEQQQRLTAFLTSCRHIWTEDGRGCPRYPVEIREDYAVLVEPAWEYDPDTDAPRAKPIEEGHVQRFWRSDVPKPWVQRVSPADELESR